MRRVAVPSVGTLRWIRRARGWAGIQVAAQRAGFGRNRRAKRGSQQDARIGLHRRYVLGRVRKLDLARHLEPHLGQRGVRRDGAGVHASFRVRGSASHLHLRALPRLRARRRPDGRFPPRFQSVRAPSLFPTVRRYRIPHQPNSHRPELVAGANPVRCGSQARRQSDRRRALPTP